MVITAVVVLVVIVWERKTLFLPPLPLPPLFLSLSLSLSLLLSLRETERAASTTTMTSPQRLLLALPVPLVPSALQVSSNAAGSISSTVLASSLVPLLTPAVLAPLAWLMPLAPPLLQTLQVNTTSPVSSITAFWYWRKYSTHANTITSNAGATTKMIATTSFLTFVFLVPRPIKRDNFLVHEPKS